jgi:hypothetical protein
MVSLSNRNIDVAKLDPAIVHTGDVILLRVQKGSDNGYLCCDGVTNNDLSAKVVKVNEDLSDIRDCLFRVIYKLDYNAYEDYHRLLELNT